MATLLSLLCQSAANAQLIGRSHPTDIVALLTAISRGDKLITREQTARLLFTALAHVLWATDDGAELRQRLRAAPAVLDRCSVYMRSHSLEPVTHGPAAAVPIGSMNVAGRQTMAALCILLMTLSDGCINDESLVPALIRVDCWALKSCGPEATILELGGVISQLLCCLLWLWRRRSSLPRHNRVLRRMAAMLCLGLTRREPHGTAEAREKFRS